MLAVSASAHSAEPTPAERMGPQFLFGWYAEEQDTARKALQAIEGKPGIDATLMGRQDRVLRKFDVGYTFYDQDWHRIDGFQFVTPSGRPWSILQFTLPEMILTGFSISRDRYCRWQDQDMDEMRGRAYCLDRNRRAIALFRKIQRGLPGADASHRLTH